MTSSGSRSGESVTLVLVKGAATHRRGRRGADQAGRARFGEIANLTIAAGAGMAWLPWMLCNAMARGALGLLRASRERSREEDVIEAARVRAEIIYLADYRRFVRARGGSFGKNGQ